MPAVVASARIRCCAPAEAAAYAAYLIDHEGLAGVAVDGATVTVPGMTPAGVIELAELAVQRGHASDAAEQRAQCILVNNTKPLPKGLIHELLPDAAGTLPTALMVRQLPATLIEALNYDPGSPLYRRIQTPTNPAGTIKDTSMLKLLA